MDLERITEDSVIDSNGFRTEFKIKTTQWIKESSMDGKPIRVAEGFDYLTVDSEKGGRKGRIGIQPEEFATEPTMPKSRLNKISAVQVIPFQSEPHKESYRAIVGTDNNCCYGAVLYLAIDVYDTGKTVDIRPRLLNAVPVPFNIGGILGTKETIWTSGSSDGGAIVYGSGCDGAGIRLIDFTTGTVAPIISTAQANSCNLGTKYLFKRPIAREGRLYIPETVDQRGRVCEPLDIEEAFRKTQDEYTIEHILPRIKADVARSIFLYAKRPGN